jgi:hypothetical protein
MPARMRFKIPAALLVRCQVDALLNTPGPPSVTQLGLVPRA